MKITNSRFLPVLLISFSLIYNSCASRIGYKMGKKADDNNPFIEIVNREYYEKIKRSQKISVHFWDNRSKFGMFWGIQEEYLILKTEMKIEEINLEDIQSIEIKWKNYRNMKWLGLGVGLALDFVLVGLLYVAFILSIDNLNFGT